MELNINLDKNIKDLKIIDLEVPDLKESIEKEDRILSILEEKIVNELNIDISDIDDIEQIEDGTCIITINEVKAFEYNEVTGEMKKYKKPERTKVKLTMEEKNKIAEENLPLIHYVLKSLNNTGVMYDELFSVGMVGYAKALDSYDKSREVKFSTYAINCIKNEVLFFLRKENKHNQNTTSLNKILSIDKNGNNLELEEIMADDKMGDKGLEDIILEEENKQILLKAMEYLKEEERFILIYRFGLDRGIIKTQKEIADTINMSQANVSKIQKNCLHKLKLILRKEMNQ